MNNVYVKDLKDNDSLNMNLLINSVTKGITNAGAPYLSITFSDKTGSIEGKLWDVKPTQVEIAKVGSVVLVEGDANLYKGVLQIKIHTITPVEEADMSEFLVSSDISIEDLKNEITLRINSINNTNLLNIVSTIMKENEEEFYLHAAASKVHHNYQSGLAEHTLGMLKMCEEVARNYPILNKDLLISGALVHDIGKIKEIKKLPSNEYTTEGKLLGHISIMQAYIYEVSKKLNLEDSEESILLRHMVLSHHGEYEFGSPVLPMIPEAEALTMIDNLDARMNILKKEFNNIKDHEFTQKIFAFDNRCFYKHNIREESEKPEQTKLELE